MNKFVSKGNLSTVWDKTKEQLEKKIDKPLLGEVGHVLTKTADGVKWAAATLETDMIDAQRFSDNFEEALRAAIAFAKTGKRTLIDARSFTGKHTCNSRFVVDCPVTIMLGNIKATMKDSVFFDIKSDNVVIEGKNRHADNTVLSGENTTELILQGISQNYNEGYHIYSHGVKSCQYKNMTLTGVRSSVRSQEGSTSTPIDGTGGIFIEKEDPGTTGAGNTCNNIIIEGILINGSKAAGIYIDTPILTEIRNVRVSAAGGHGIYLSGGTSVLLESCYVSSANYAGFCLEKLTYATVINSVAETCGCGWWIRSCSNISLLSPGCESTTILPKNPWSTQYNETKRYGKGLTTRSASGEVIKVKDVTDDYWELGDQKIYARGLFLGYGFVITGGKYITLYTPYVTTIAQQTNATAAGSLSADVLQVLSYLMVLGAARNVTIVNFGAKENSGSSLPSKLIHEIAVGKEVDGFDLSYNPNEAVIPTYTDLVTDSFSTVAPIFNEAKDVNIHSGNQFFVKMQMSGVATTDYIDQAIAEAKSQILGGAGEDYDTLKEIEKWITEHQDLYEALLAAMGDKATKAELQSAVEDVNQEVAKKFDNPTNEGAPGQVLTKTEDGAEWQDIPECKSSWITLARNENAMSPWTILLDGTLKFFVTGQENIQLDANGRNVVLDWLESKPTILTFENGKAITGYENTRFRTYKFEDDSVLTGALVLTPEGLYIHDGSNFENFTGVVISTPTQDFTLTGLTTVSVEIIRGSLFTSNGTVLDHINWDLSTPEGRAMQLIAQNYDGPLVFTTPSYMMTYWWICINFPEVVARTEKILGYSLNINPSYMFALPRMWKEWLIVKEWPKEVYEDLDATLEELTYFGRGFILIDLTNIENAESEESLQYIQVGDITYEDYCTLCGGDSMLEDMWAMSSGEIDDLEQLPEEVIENYGKSFMGLNGWVGQFQQAPDGKLYWATFAGSGYYYSYGFYLTDPTIQQRFNEACYTDISLDTLSDYLAASTVEAANGSWTWNKQLSLSGPFVSHSIQRAPYYGTLAVDGSTKFLKYIGQKEGSSYNPSQDYIITPQILEMQELMGIGDVESGTPLILIQDKDAGALGRLVLSHLGAYSYMSTQQVQVAPIALLENKAARPSNLLKINNIYQRFMPKSTTTVVEKPILSLDEATAKLAAKFPTLTTKFTKNE